MPTTSLKLGCAFCKTCLYDFGGDWTEEECKILGDAICEKFEELAQATTGDKSINWQPATSEIQYECRGTTDGEGHWSDPATEWPEGVDFLEILRESQQYVMDHSEKLLATANT